MTLAELKARVDEAEEGSRELDALIWAAMEGLKVTYEGPDEGHSEVWAEGLANTYHLGYRDDGQHTKHFTPVLQVDPVSTSVDAALALIEAKLPGYMVINLCEWEHEVQRARGPWMAQLKPRGTQGDLRFLAFSCTHARTPALALCSALLAALIAKEQA